MKKTARATLAASAGGALLAATLVALPATTAVASETECDAPTAGAPVRNTWASPSGHYRGTRMVYRDQVIGHATDVYETFGDGYRQIEVWERNGYHPAADQRTECFRQPAAPVETPPEPVITERAGGWEVDIRFEGFHRTVSAPKSWGGTRGGGKVRIGEIESY
ncbi:hypothetical protein [Agromyces sp. NBRC 114283]|uniref:hypothetical protein n=1 Tax=Agromyces sp. NBRC 114283 TaxID=2994521 RepID=UPI0024A5DA0E|nr:hypothetical protein [Agromyces sp. NBRC 114283]GLU88226.1 hypothetical protein Agsp01_04810 [Agromyces sp. NBRC 114283]